jgi:hypothetical protein
MTKGVRDQRLDDKSTDNSSIDIADHRLSKCRRHELSDSSLYLHEKVALSVLKNDIVGLLSLAMYAVHTLK